ncbi:amidohydrolase family protein, partial [Thermodesulfobacteriota bacterium]
AKGDSGIHDKLLDTGEGRLKFMDDAGVDMQVLSGHGVQSLESSDGIEWSKKANNKLSEVVEKHPDRFIGLASVAPQSPDEAVEELERAVKELGLKGLCIQSHARDEYLDDRKYWPIFEMAEKLDVPIYLHPAIPSKAILKPYADQGFYLSGPVLGFAADLALHTMRLIHSGLFDMYPKLKIILGHMGEGLPYWLPRLDFYWTEPHVSEDLPIKKKPSEYIKTNFTITTSGLFFQPALICAYMALGADKIAFAVDYPHEDTEKALRFIKEAPICDSDREKICHLNAEKLFKL